MAQSQKTDFVFRRNGRVHLNRRGHQFSRLLAAKLCASVVVMLDTTCSEVVWRVLATHSTRQFPFSSSPVRHHVPSHFNWTIPLWRTLYTVQNHTYVKYFCSQNLGSPRGYTHLLNYGYYNFGSKDLSFHFVYSATKFCLLCHRGT